MAVLHHPAWLHHMRCQLWESRGKHCESYMGGALFVLAGIALGQVLVPTNP